MIPRTAKIALVAAVALFYSVFAFNNLADYGSNYQFVYHVLRMDSTFPGNRLMGRAITSPIVIQGFYLSIIAWEIITTILLWWGVVRMTRVLRSPARVFHGAKRLASAALTISLLMWLTAFLTVGGEWFLMWQSPVWNGQNAAFRNFAVVGIVLLILSQGESEVQK
jgi:predicted small integral membrane protein